MKTITTLMIVSLYVMASSPLNAQSSLGPFGNLIDKPIESHNIFLLWQEMQPSGDVLGYQKVYTFNTAYQSDNLPVNERLTATPRVNDTRLVDGARQMTVASGYFRSGLYENVVSAWEGENSSIELFIPHFDTTSSMWSSGTSYTVPGPLTSVKSYVDARILLETGDFDGSGTDGFVLVYQGADRQIHAEVYNVNDNLVPVRLDSVAVAEVPETAFIFTPATMATGDLTGNGRDEIIIAGLRTNAMSDGRWAIFINLYELGDDNRLHLIAEHLDFPDPAALFPYTRVQYIVQTGRFRGGSKSDFIFGWSFDARLNTAMDTFFYPMEFIPETGTFNRNSRIGFNIVSDANRMDPLCIAAGDLNGDGRDEVVIAAEGTHYVYTIDDELIYTKRTEFNQTHTVFGMSYDFMEITDINQDGKKEVVVGLLARTASEEYFLVQVFKVFDDEKGWLQSAGSNQIITLGSLANDELIPPNSAGPRRYALTTGNFNGNTFRLGQPEYYIDREKVQPLVILNAPPIHFDIFDDTVFDINRCYSGGGGDCGFKSIYEISNEVSSRTSTEVKSDYGFSIGAGISGAIETAPMGIGGSVNFEAYFDKTFGKNFSNVTSEGKTTRISVRSTAAEDDRIYATITDYDVWEYPAYYGTEVNPRRYIMAVVPRETRSQWFSSKSWTAAGYIPNHEIGNILSYPSYSDAASNPQVDKLIVFNETFGLDANTNDNWSLNIESFTQNDADTTFKSGYDAKLDAIVRVKRDYTGSDISTHSTTVREGLNIAVELGSINRSYGENRFSVTPYAYWSKEGALVVDYAVAPERSAPGGSNTWWEVRYGQKPDPAFILPWRYDPEKGFGIEEEVKRNQTKDIFFDFDFPVLGDTIVVTARVRNFSLIDSPPVTVHFFVGDPDAGGIPITGTGGETHLVTPGIPAQRFQDVELSWAVPAGLPSFPRVYALIDKDGVTDEIHLNNNKGFNILGQGNIIVSIDDHESKQLPQTAELYAPYPNPFNPSTNIRYNVARAGEVTIEIYTILGQKVETLYSGLQATGSHHLVWDAAHRSSGMYLVTLRTADGIRTQKMILIK